MIMDGWTLDDLLSVRKYINPELSEKDVTQRLAEYRGIV
jgi:hypothetical protein